MAEETAVVPDLTAEEQAMRAALLKHESLGGEHFRYVRRKTLPAGIEALRRVLWMSVCVYEGSHTGADDWQQLLE